MPWTARSRRGAARRSIFAYDSKRTAGPPATFAALLAYARANPGRVTYPAPPDFTGSAFVRMAVQVLGEDAAIAYLRELEPLLWRGGRSHPKSEAELNRLFGDGAGRLAMSYDPAFVADRGSPGNVLALARGHCCSRASRCRTSASSTIPANAASSAGAQVVADILLDPDLQAAKADPAVLGVPSVLASDGAAARRERSYLPADLGRADRRAAGFQGHGDRAALAHRGPALMLTCRELTVCIDDTVILAGLDLELPAGELTALVGPSGAGKTTLLRAIAGLQRVESGTIDLGGSPIVDLPAHRRGVGLVFQQPRLLPHLNVIDNVAFPLRLARVARAERTERARALLSEVGLAGMADRGVRGLSGGEQQRVALARALSARPRLLLLDEPLSALDPARRDELRDLIAAIVREHGLTTLLVTHDRAEAARLGDSLAIMLEGHVVQTRRPARAVRASALARRRAVSGSAQPAAWGGA